MSLSSGNSENTTLCYIGCGDKCLFIHRNRRENDVNAGKWLGVGGHFEAGESPEECIAREIAEEAGIDTETELASLRFRGLVTFVSDKYGTEYMHVFDAEYTGQRDICPGDCDEGELVWVPVKDMYGLPVWEGDRIIFDCLRDEGFFSLKLVYEGDRLTAFNRFQ